MTSTFIRRTGGQHGPFVPRSGAAGPSTLPRPEQDTAVRTDTGPPTSAAADLAATLSAHARALYEDGRLVPLLRRLMTTSCTLTNSLGSSISIIDPDAGRYTKVAERGTACRLGQSFPLDEGVTGRVMATRRPIVLDSYQDVATGHLPADSRAREGAVVAIPIWWRGDVIGANVVFAGRTRSYTTDEIDQLEVVTQVVAPGIVTAAGRDLGMADLFRRDQIPEPRGESLGPSVAEVTSGLKGLVAQVASTDPVHLRVVREESGLRLQVQDVGDAAGSWRELIEDEDGVVTLAPADPVPAGAVPSCPFTSREQQVVALLSRGSSDRAIAEVLLISPKTAEKHVGAVLRKTGTTSRTAAVVHALEHGWVPTGTPVRV